MRMRYIFIAALLVGSALANMAYGKPARGWRASYAKRARTAERPVLQKSYVSPSGTFRFHYDVGGGRAVPKADLNTNGVPDWVETAAHVADSVLNVYRALGFKTSLGDGGLGGGPEYDIYFLNLASSYYYGLTYYGGDHYMELDNDYAETWVYESTGTDGLRVTIAHEMFHAVQFLYRNTWADGWWLEMTATFMEEVMYDRINDYYQYLNPEWYNDTIFEDPIVGLDHEAENSAHPYGGAVFLCFLWEKYGDAAFAAIRRTFEEMEAHSSSDIRLIIGTLEQTLGTPVRDMLAEFWVWSYFTGDRARPGLFFEEGANYRPMPLDTLFYKSAADRWTIRSLPALGTVSDTVAASHLGAVLLRIVPDGSLGGFRAWLDPQGYDWTWRIAVADSDTVRIFSPVFDAQTGRYLIVIAGENWHRATEIVLVAANGETAGSAVPFGYTLTFDRSLEVAMSLPQPQRVILGQNVPNPFNPSTTIPVWLDRAQPVSLIIYDALGRPVRTLAEGMFPAGAYRFVWDGRTDEDRPAGTGVYFVRLITPTRQLVRRMVLVR